MSNSSFEKWQNQIFDRYGRGEYQEALEAVHLMTKEYPEKAYKTSLWIACLNCRLNNLEEAIEELKSAMEKGIWWSPERLLPEQDLKPIHHLEEFKEIVDHCRRLLFAAQENSKAELFVLNPNHQNNHSLKPLILTLHWRGDNAKSFSQYWNNEEVKTKYIFAFPQSSQVHGTNEFCWDNQKIAENEIEEVYQRIATDYRIKTDKVILAGASQGGKLAIEMALQNRLIPSRGFIAVVPSIKDIDPYIPMIQSATKKGIRGCIITGDKDHFYPKVKELYAVFEKFDFPCKLIVKEGLGHSFPKDFSALIPLAANYILGENKT